MSALLRIDVSPRGDESISRALSAAFVEEWQSAHPGSSVISRDLDTTDLPFVDLPWMAGAHAPPEHQTPESSAAKARSGELIDEILAATHIVLATPMYNFNLPSRLKAWIDHVVYAGRTFKVDETGYHGLAGGRKLTLIVASTGVYTPGTPAAGYDFLTPYLKGIFGFMGITDIQVVYAGDTVSIRTGKTDRATYLAPKIEDARSAARA